jgi:hypothetical protein
MPWVTCFVDQDDVAPWPECHPVQHGMASIDCFADHQRFSVACCPTEDGRDVAGKYLDGGWYVNM